MPRAVVGTWEITVLNVTESKYLVHEYWCYTADEEEKIIGITIKVRNIGERINVFRIDRDDATLTTDKGKIYSLSGLDLERLDLLNITNETLAKAIEASNPIGISDLFSASLAPNAYIEGDLIFKIPENETPQELCLYIGLASAELVLPSPTAPIAKQTRIIKAVYASLGESIEVDTWRLTVLGVNESHFIKEKEIGYFQAKEGLKFVVIKIRLENIGAERAVPFGEKPGQLRIPVIVTDKGRVFELDDPRAFHVYPAHLVTFERIECPSKEVVEKAIDLEYFSFDAICEVGKAKEGHVWATIPEDEKPVKLITGYIPPLLGKPLVRVEVILIH
jgi:hypothetical protein